MVTSLALTRPLDAAAVMVGSCPVGYELPEVPRAQQVAWVYGFNPQFERWVADADEGTVASIPAKGVSCLSNASEPYVALYCSGSGLTVSPSPAPGI